MHAIAKTVAATGDFGPAGFDDSIAPYTSNPQEPHLRSLRRRRLCGRPDVRRRIVGQNGSEDPFRMSDVVSRIQAALENAFERESPSTRTVQSASIEL